MEKDTTAIKSYFFFSFLVISHIFWFEYTIYYKKKNMTKEELQKLVNESNSYREILVKQGKSISGAAIKLLKSTLDSYGIDTHLLYERKPQMDLSESKEITSSSTR